MAVPIITQFAQPFPHLGPKRRGHGSVGFVHKDGGTRHLMELSKHGGFVRRQRLEELDRRGYDHGRIPSLRELAQIAPVLALELDTVVMSGDNLVGRLAVKHEGASV